MSYILLIGTSSRVTIVEISHRQSKLRNNVIRNVFTRGHVHTHDNYKYLINKLEPLGLVLFRARAPIVWPSNREAVPVASTQNRDISPVYRHRVLRT